MELYLKRTIKLEKRTFGKLVVNGTMLYTIEDKDRGLASDMDVNLIKQTKIKAATAIPIGRYQIKKTYSVRFGKEKLILLRVPGFDGIRIHSGNTEAHTEGCLIVGMKTDFKTKVLESKKAERFIEDYIFKALETETVFINIS